MNSPVNIRGGDESGLSYGLVVLHFPCILKVSGRFSAVGYGARLCM